MKEAIKRLLERAVSSPAFGVAYRLYERLRYRQ